MIATKERIGKNAQEVVPMPRKPKTKPPTSPTRIHTDVLELAEVLAPLFKESVPEFVSNILRPILEKKRAEAADRLKRWPPKIARA